MRKSKRSSFYLIFLLGLMLTFSTVACDDGEAGDDAGQQVDPKKDAGVIADDAGVTADDAGVTDTANKKVIGAAGGEVYIEQGRALIPPGALAADIELSIERVNAPGNLPSGYELADANYAYNFLPSEQVFSKYVTLRFPYQNNKKALFVFRYDAEKLKWYEVSGVQFGGGYAQFYSKQFGTFAVMRAVIAPTIGVTLQGSVYDWGSVQNVPVKDVVLKFTNVKAVDAAINDPFLSAPPSDVAGNFQMQKVPPGSAIYLESYLAQNDPVFVPSTITNRKVIKTENTTPQIISASVVKFSWLAQVAFECKIFDTFDEASGATQGSINPYWISKSVIVGTVKDSQGKPLAGVAKGEIHVDLAGYDNYDGKNTTKLCWLKSDGVQYQGTEGENSYAGGRFVMFQVRDANGTGQGVASVSAAGFETVTVPLASTGNIGIVSLYKGEDVLNPPIDDDDAVIDFETQVYPIFTQFGCVGCHYSGGPGALNINGFYADFSGDADEVFTNIVGPGTSCVGVNPRRVCVENPAQSLLVVNPLQEPLGVAPDHPNASFETLDDPKMQYIYKWIAQGAARSAGVIIGDNDEVAEHSLEAVIDVANTSGCLGCHSYTSASGGLALNGCIQALIDDGTYNNAGIDTTDPQNCVYYHLVKEGVQDDPYAYGYRVNPTTGETKKSMLLRNPYCGPGKCVGQYAESHPQVFFAEEDETKNTPYGKIYSWIKAGAKNNKDADL